MGSTDRTVSLVGFENDPVRPAPMVGPPPLVGWRTTLFKRPHLQNQLIRRHHRSEWGSWFSDDFVILERKVRPLEQQGNEISRAINAAFRKEFAAHAKKWQEDTALLSSVEDIALHPSYQRIL